MVGWATEAGAGGGREGGTRCRRHCCGYCSIVVIVVTGYRQRGTDAAAEAAGLTEHRYLVLDVGWEVNFVIEHVWRGTSAREAEEARVGTGAQRDDLLLYCRVS